MQIKADGGRSRKRIGLARKWLGDLKMLGLPAKAIEHDGFKYALSNLDDGLESAVILAPMGAIVVCSTLDGVFVSCADWYLGAFDNGVLHAPVPATENLPNRIPSNPTVFTDSSGEPYRPTQPGVLAYSMDEAPIIGFAGAMSDSLRFENMLAGWYTPVGSLGPRTIYTSSVTISVRKQVSLQVLPTSDGAIAYASERGKLRLLNNSSKLYTGVIIFLSNTVFSGQSIYDVDIVLGAIPSALADRMTSPYTSNVYGLGSYAVSLVGGEYPSVVVALDGSNQDWVISPPQGHPSYDDYGLMLAHFNPATSEASYIGKAALNAFLTAYIGVGGAEGLQQLFGWPVTGLETVPPDTAMFHDDAGRVYTWTRKYGSFRMHMSGSGADGLRKYDDAFTAIKFPEVVHLNPGVRPEVYRADGEGTYFLIAYKPGKLRVYGTSDSEKKAKLADWQGVRGVFFGTPFVSALAPHAWVEIPPPDPGTFRLLSVRLIQFSGASSILTGVVSDIPDPDDPEPPPPKHWFCMRIDSQWRILSPLNFDVQDRDTVQLATGVFGADPRVYSAGKNFAQPHITPQTPVLPYTVAQGLQP